MTARASSILLPFLVAGCIAAPRPEANTEEAVSAVVEGLYSPDPVRRALARTLLDDIGPAGEPVLRGLLTRRTEPADPLLRDLVASLDARESLDVLAAREQIVRRGRRAAPDLWEALLSTESPVLALRALGILAQLDGAARVRSTVEALWTWGTALKWLDQVPVFQLPPARLALVSDAEGEPTFVRRSRKLTEDVTMRQYLAELDEISTIPDGVILFPVDRSEK